MKKVALAMGLLALVSVAVFAETGKEPSPSDGLVAHLSYCLAGQKQEMTAEQEKALRLVHPLLAIAAEKDRCRKGFWKAAATSEVTEIEWEDAKRMILEGRVVQVFQAHSKYVRLLGTDGRTYRSTEPRLDDVLHLTKEVDPKSVFIVYSTE
jgi:hypothetical protein